MDRYWKVVAEYEAQEVFSLFTPDVKRRWKVMHMGDLNAGPMIVSMMMKLQI